MKTRRPDRDADGGRVLRAVRVQAEQARRRRGRSRRRARRRVEPARADRVRGRPVGGLALRRGHGLEQRRRAQAISDSSRNTAPRWVSGRPRSTTIVVSTVRLRFLVAAGLDAGRCRSARAERPRTSARSPLRRAARAEASSLAGEDRPSSADRPHSISPPAGDCLYSDLACGPKRSYAVDVLGPHAAHVQRQVGGGRRGRGRAARRRGQGEESSASAPSVPEPPSGPGSWGARIRTGTSRLQRPAGCHYTTPQRQRDPGTHSGPILRCAGASSHRRHPRGRGGDADALLRCRRSSTRCAAAR